MQTFNLEIARTNLQSQIASAREALAKLEEGERLLEDENLQSKLSVIELVHKLGRTAPPANGVPQTLAKNATVIDVVRTMVNASALPLRMEDIVSTANAHGRKLQNKRVGQALTVLANKGEIVKVQRGLYGKKATPKGAAVVAAVNRTTTPPEWTGDDYVSALANAIRAVLKEKGDSMNTPEIAAALVAAKFPFQGKKSGAKHAIARNLAKDHSGVKRHGSGPHTRYSLSSSGSGGKA